MLLNVFYKINDFRDVNILLCKEMMCNCVRTKMRKGVVILQTTKSNTFKLLKITSDIVYTIFHILI